MRRLWIPALVIACTSGAIGYEPAVRGEIENVAAFARLYGVVRYFYPSDAAAALDWDRFAVYGVKEVRNAPDADALGAALTGLFSPLGPGITIATKLPPAATGKPDETLVAWRYLGPGIGMSTASGPYGAKRTHRPMVVGGSNAGFSSLMQMLPATDFRGKTIRLSARVRAPVATAGGAAIWVRVDRPNGAMGFFDNMQDRPVRLPDWREYSIEGPVANDATNVAFGAMQMGAATADFDAVRLAVADGKGGWTDVAIKDSGFEASADAPDWSRVGSPAVVIARPAGDAPEGRQFLRISSPSATTSNAELFAAVPVSGAHADLTLGGGLFARVPLVLSDVEASRVRDSKQLEALRTAIGLIDVKNSPPDVDLADIVVAWNVFRHFYPYWTEAGVDWDTRLRPQLEAAYAAQSRDAQLQVLRALVADARDGHGNVSDARTKSERSALPLRFSVADGKLVIVATDAPTDAPVGAVVSAINGVPAAQRLADLVRLTSGTSQWKQARALRELTTCTRGGSIELTFENAGGSRRIPLQCTATQPPIEKRPAPLAELRPGVWYVDLTMASAAQVTAKLDTLAAAAGVIFDVRGYPTDAGAAVLPYLISAPEEDRWMHVAKIVGPFGESAGWEDYGWDLKPKAPHVAGRVVFLTDGRAISYAESVMGYVADRKLGTIVGGPTAGTNGNVAAFPVPGGFNIGFTGMRVTRHDGRSPYHLIGVKPDVLAAPTLASIREGRDRVLEAALGVIEGRRQKAEGRRQKAEGRRQKADGGARLDGSGDR